MDSILHILSWLLMLAWFLICLGILFFIAFLIAWWVERWRLKRELRR